MTPGKRALDLLAGGVGLVVGVPVFLVVAAAVKLDDGGPVFFRQERVGRHGRRFRIWKFRSMAADAERTGRPLTVGDDPRVTRVGRWLRAWKLDELPQLLNVVRGEMSLVGPRPEVPRYVELYTLEQSRVLDLTPGITDPASIRYRNEAEALERADDPEAAYIDTLMPEKIRLNLEYGDVATVWSDLRVILRTLGAVIHVVKPG
jgi:lipopolysaccharide/colanic/teichoic acid biosynthesis glycosyltransferase